MYSVHCTLKRHRNNFVTKWFLCFTHTRVMTKFVVTLKAHTYYIVREERVLHASFNDNKCDSVQIV